MKKIIISLAAASALLFTGCFIDSDTATVRINLGNLPVAKVEKKSLIDRFLMIFAKEAVAQQVPLGITAVHIGAFDSNNQLLAKKSISVDNYPENNIVSFDVPARSGVTIVVLGEEEIMGPLPTYEITFYGRNEVPLSLTAGATENVEIWMNHISELIYISNFRYTSAPAEYNAPIAWDIIFGSSKIDLEYNTDQLDPTYFELIYSGSGNNCINDSYESFLSDSYRVTLHFDFAGQSSDAIEFGIGGD